MDRVFGQPALHTPRTDVSAINPPFPDGCESPYSQTYFVDHGTQVPLSLQSGALCFPFASIQQALDAIGTPANAADQARTFNVLCAAGTYTENLIVPARRRIVIQPLGEQGVTLAGGVAWTSPLGPTSVPPLLALLLDVTGTVVLADGGTAALNLFALQGSAGAVDATIHVTGLAGVFLGAGGSVGSVLGTATLLFADQYDVSGALSAFLVDTAHRTRFAAVTVTAAPVGFTAAPRGYNDCELTGAFTGPADSVRVDGVTEFSIEQNNITLLGGATVARFDDPMLRSVDVSLAPGNFTMDFPNRIVFVTATAPGRTVFLPNVASVSPKRDDFAEVKDASGTAGANPITIDGNGLLIDGAATATIAANYGALSLRFNGTAWFIV